MSRRWSSVLEWRERQRDQASIAVGKATQAITAVDQEIEKLRQEIRNSEVSNEDRVGSVSVDRLLGEGRYRFVLEAQVGGLLEARAKFEEERDRLREVLLQAQFEVKRIERLAEKERQREADKRHRLESAEAEEAALRQFAMNRLATNRRQTGEGI